MVSGEWRALPLVTDGRAEDGARVSAVGADKSILSRPAHNAGSSAENRIYFWIAVKFVLRQSEGCLDVLIAQIRVRLNPSLTRFVLGHRFRIRELVPVLLHAADGGQSARILHLMFLLRRSNAGLLRWYARD